MYSKDFAIIRRRNNGTLGIETSSMANQDMNLLPMPMFQLETPSLSHQTDLISSLSSYCP